MEEIKKKVNDRAYVMIQADAKDKAAYKAGSEFDGFKAVSHWFRHLAFNRMKKQEKERDEKIG